MLERGVKIAVNEVKALGKMEEILSEVRICCIAEFGYCYAEWSFVFFIG